MMLRSVSLAILISLSGGAAAAQRLDINPPPRVPATGGSWIATMTGATVGAAAGFGFGAVLVSNEPEFDGAQFAFIAATTVLGAASGAMIGRQLTGGNQSVLHSALGASVGLLAGGWIASRLRIEEPVPLVIAMTIPTGLFATLAGW